MAVKHLYSVFCVRMCLCVAIFLSFAGCSREPEKIAVLPPSSTNEVVSATTVLAVIADQEKPHSIDPGLANKPAFHVEFNESGRGVAYIAEMAGRLHVVHNGTAGRPYQAVENLRISPDGRRVAYSVPVDGRRSLVADGVEEMPFDDVGVPVFSPDSKHIAYKATNGDLIYIVVDNRMSKAYRSYNGNPVFSADSTKVAYSEGADGNRKSRLIISDLSFDKQTVRESSGDLMVTNPDKTRIAAVNSVGNKQRVIEISFRQPDAIKEGPLYDAVSHLAFGKDGTSLTYAAEKGGARFLVLNGREERLPEAALVAPLVVRPDRQGVGAIMASSEHVFLHQAFYREGAEEKQYDEIEDLVYDSDGNRHAFAARKGRSWFAVVNGKEGPPFDRIVRPLFTPDNRLLVYRARKDGKRFVVVADADGKVIRQHPSYEMVFPPVFTADGKSVAYGVKDGPKLIWRVEKL